MVAGGRTSIRHDLPVNVGNIAIWAEDGRIEDGGPVPSGGGVTPIDLDTSAGPQTYMLTGSPSNGAQYQVKDSNGHATANPITVSAGGVVLLDGATTALINQNYGSLTFRWNAALGKWLIG